MELKHKLQAVFENMFDNEENNRIEIPELFSNVKYAPLFLDLAMEYSIKLPDELIYKIRNYLHKMEGLLDDKKFREQYSEKQNLIMENIYLDICQIFSELLISTAYEEGKADV